MWLFIKWLLYLSWNSTWLFYHFIKVSWITDFNFSTGRWSWQCSFFCHQMVVDDIMMTIHHSCNDTTDYFLLIWWVTTMMTTHHSSNDKTDYFLLIWWVTTMMTTHHSCNDTTYYFILIWWVTTGYILINEPKFKSLSICEISLNPPLAVDKLLL